MIKLKEQDFCVDYNMRYKTIAYWPLEAKLLEFDNYISTDEHNSFEEAEGVIQLLKREGFGGEGKIFPTQCEIRMIEEK